MAKNFPYFKFIATEWLTGDIVFESFDTQGLFINICALYWQRDGKLSLDDINKRYKTDLINNLIDRFLIVKDGLISINFLDEQLIHAGHISKTNSESGKKGAEAKRNKANAKRTLSERSSNLSKEEKEEEQEKEVKDKNNYRVINHLILTNEEFYRLIQDGYTKEQIDDKLDAIENSKKNKDYVSLNLTVRNWLKNNFKTQNNGISKFRKAGT